MSGVHSTLKKVAAYVGMPLLFCVLILALLTGMYFWLLDDTVSPMIRMLFTGAGGTDTGDLSSIYDGPVGFEGATVDADQVVMPTYGTVYGEVLCERIGFQADLYFGDPSEALRGGAAQTMNSLMPGFGYPTLVSGHNNRVFNLLQFVEVGDIFVVHTGYGTYRYRVTGTEIIQVADFDETCLLEQQEHLMLYTCYPFDTLGLTSKRFFVYTEKISGPTVLFDNKDGGDKP